MKIKFAQHSFEKYSNIKYYENAIWWSSAVPSGPADMMQLTVAGRKFANAPNK
jgi:hypothetical protein